MGVTAACVTADDWLSSYGPWQAFGERAEISRHYLLAGELYREGLNRDEFASKTNSKAWFSLAKVLRRCGRLDESLGAARRAVEIFSEKGRGGERDSNMDLAIKAWETDGLGEFGAGGFQKELGSGSISVWVDMYLGAEGELMEGSVGNGGGGGVSLPNSKPVSVEKRRFDWYSGFEEEEEEGGGGGGDEGGKEGKRKREAMARMRREIVTVALKEDARDMLDGGEASPGGARVARLGLLCAAHRHVSLKLARVGAALLQRCVDSGYFQEEDVGTGRRALIYRRLAECHAVVASGEGFGAEDRRWGASHRAWKAALQHMECATDVHCWEASVFVSISMGRWDVAAKTLGVLMRSFKPASGMRGGRRSAGEGRGGSYNKLLAASLLFKLGSYEQAYTYIVKILEKANQEKRGEIGGAEGLGVAPPAPLTYIHLTFLASRCFELWGSRGGGEGPKRISRAGYRRVFNKLLSENDLSAQAAAAGGGGGEGGEGGEGGDETVARWLNRIQTWERFATDLHVAGLDIFAADLLFVGINKVVVRQGNEKGRRKSIVAISGGGSVGGETYIELAKYYMNSGQVEEAKETLMIAKAAQEGQGGNNKRVVKALGLMDGEFRSAPTLKKMKSKHLDELLEMVLLDDGEK